MEILVRRLYRKEDYTIGKLYIDGQYFCDTLEDKDRGLTDCMSVESIKRIKQFGETAIPLGTYKVRFTYSPKYKREMPLVETVKGFQGIRIHSGNTAKDTLGCLLLGENKEKGKVLNSRITCEKFYNILRNAKGKIALRITY